MELKNYKALNIESIEQWNSNGAAIIDALAVDTFDNLSEVIGCNDIDYMDRDAVKSLVAKWYTAKKSVVDYLSTLNGWNWQELEIRTTISELVRGNATSANNDAAYLLSEVADYLNDEQPGNNLKYSVVKYAISKILNYYCDNDYRVSNEYREQVNALFDFYKLPLFKKDITILKYANKFIQDSREALGDNGYRHFNANITRLLETAKDKKIDYKLLITINPAAYFYTSESDYFTSCYNISDSEGGGCYRAGILSYLCDDKTLLTYLFNIDEDADKFDERQAIFRKYLHIDTSKNIVLFGRLYPQDNDSNHARNTCLENALSKVINATYSTSDAARDLYRGSHLNGCGYADLHYIYGYYNSGNGAAVINGADISTLSELVDSGYCFKYGSDNANALDNRFNEPNDDSTLLSTPAGERVYCEDIDDYASEDDAVYIASRDCYYTYRNATQCELCNEWEANSDIVYTYDGWTVCRDCLERHFVYCEDIDDYIRDCDAYYSEVDGCYYYYSDNAPENQEDEDDKEDAD